MTLLLVVLAAFTAIGMLGQQITGSLTGIVLDKSSAVVPNAKVTLTNEQSGDVRRTQTNAEGYFSIQGVFPGAYSVSIEAPGFAIWKVEKVNFTQGDRRTLGEVTLEVATTGTEVKVSATVEELTPVDSGEKSIVLNEKQLQNVAVVGRSAAEFIKIMPGMAPITGLENRPGWNGENIGINGNGDGGKQSAIGNFSANGTRAMALDITADGAHVSDPGCNCATPVNPNPDMIQEMKVQTSNFSAENSKGPVVISSVTKGGGREFHGSAYLNARHFALNANDWLNNANNRGRPENKYFFPGGTFGGPVLIPGTNFNKNRDKMFFFTGFESYRQTIDTGLLRSVVPTTAMRNGDFSDLNYMSSLSRATAVAGADISGMYPNRIIPASERDPGMAAWFKLIPQPNANPAAEGQGYNWIDILTVDQNMWQSANRVDYSFDDNTKLFVRYNAQREVQPFPIQLWWRNAGAVPLPTPINGKNRSDSISANFTKVFSPTVTNEFVFGYTLVDFPNEYEDISKVEKSAIGYPYRGIFKQDSKIPGFLSWAGPTAGLWMAGGFDPVLFATKHLFTINNNFSKVAGTHTMKFGGYYGYIVNKQPGNEPSAGLGVYANWHGNTTGNVLADMVRGSLNDYTENTLQIVRDMGWGEFAFYGQDNWKVTPRLTLEYGLRIQHIQPWTARNGIGIATWNPQAYSPTAPGSSLPGIDWHKKNQAISLAGWDTRALFYAPRAGFAWDIFGKGSTVFRGGFGSFIYHDEQLASGAMDLPAGVRRVNVSGGPFLRDLDRITDTGSLVFGGEAVDSRDNKMPRTMSWSATISQRLPGRNLLEVSYVGNKSDNLVNQGGLTNINVVPRGAMLNDPFGDTNAYRPLRQYGDLNVRSHTFYANYHSLQATLARQVGNLNYTIAYTWSKAMGIVSNTLDNFTLENNYGPLAFDRTHLLSASYVYTLPSPVKGNLVAQGLVNGWQLSGIVQATSGVNLQQVASNNFNLNAVIPGDTQGRTFSGQSLYGTNAITATPRVICDPKSGLKEGQYINSACFAPPILGAPGQPGVGGPLIMPYMRGPAFFNTDLSLFKNFKIDEAKNLQFRFSAFNFPNHPVRSFVNGDQNLRLDYNAAGVLNNSRFGYADSKVGRRVIQLAVKFFF